MGEKEVAVTVALFATPIAGMFWSGEPTEDEGVPVTVIGLERRGDGIMLALYVDGDGIAHADTWTQVDFTSVTPTHVTNSDVVKEPITP